jgi:hypothetical protein
MIDITKTLHCTSDLGSVVDVNVSAGQISGLNHDAATYSVSVETIHFHLNNTGRVKKDGRKYYICIF